MTDFGYESRTIWLTNSGWPSYFPRGYRSSEAIQGEWLPKFIAAANARGDVGGFALYNFKDTGAHEITGDEYWAYWGIVRPDWTLKPAYKSIRDLLRAQREKQSADE